MQFLIAAVGSIGDVFPLVGIGAGLRQRGHRVVMLANPYFAEAIAAADLELAPLGTRAEQEAVMNHPDAWHPWRGWKVWVGGCGLSVVRQMYDAVLEHYVPGETVAAGSWGGFGARIAQETHGVPYASLHVEPDKLRTVHDAVLLAPPHFNYEGEPHWFRRFGFWLADKAFVDPFCSSVASFRAELGLPPAVGYCGNWMHSPQRVVGLFPDWWGAPQPDWPPQAVATGWPLYDGAQRELPDEVRAYLGAGEPPIVFSPGALNAHAARFFAAAAQACGRLGRRGMLLTKFADAVPQTLPPGVERFAYVPFGPLLPRAAAVVSHAGTGTVAACLAAGVPMVCTPLMYPHPDTVRRLKRLGVATSMSPRRVTADRLAVALDQVLNSPQIHANCSAVKASFVGTDPVGDTCTLLEELIGSDSTAAVLKPHATDFRARC